MSYSEFNDFLKKNGTPRTDAKDGEIALTKADALKSLELLADTNSVVLGGDVYILESDGYFSPTYDNWCYKKVELPPSEVAEKSRKRR